MYQFDTCMKFDYMYSYIFASRGVGGGGCFRYYLAHGLLIQFNNTISLRVSYRKYGKDMLAISTLK